MLGSVTIDYGPFGFIDEYNPSFTPNHSDDMGRYDLENQVQSQSNLLRMLDLHVMKIFQFLIMDLPVSQFHKILKLLNFIF